MPTFRIEWENDIYNITDPLAAVKICYEDIKNGETLAFTVTNLSTDEKFSVDLNELEGDEVCEISND